MNSHTATLDRLSRELRVLKAYAVISSLVLIGLVIAGFARSSTRFGVIEAERINVVNADGKLALAIAGHGRLPGPTFEGKEYPQALSGGRTAATGMIFFNERGDEVGGLVYRGQLQGDGHEAFGGLTFDQFRQDQVVSLSYDDDGRDRSAGVRVWDRSTVVSIADVLEVVDARSRATGAARDSLERIIAGWREMGGSAQRIFLGSANRTAALVMRDPAGRPRIRLAVDSLGAARLVFLDSAGTEVHAIPE